MTVADRPQSPPGGHPTPELRQAREGGTSATFSKIPTAMIGRVSANALAVAAALAECAKNKTGECFPSAGYLAGLLGSEERPAPHPNTVRRGIKELKAAGFLEVTPRRRLDNNGKGIPGPPSTSNLYRLLWIASGGYTAKSPPSEGGVNHSRAGGVNNEWSTELDPVEPEPPLPPIDSHQEPSEDAGVGMESVPDTPAEVLNLEDKRAARYRSQVLAELARLEAEADAAAGTLIRSPGAYQAAIKRRLADDPELAAQIDAYRKQYPDLEAVELAERIWADRAGSPGARPPSRPTNSVDLEAYAALVAAGNRDAAAVLEVLDLPRWG